jgi:large subunit ribosomal protein L17
MRHRNAGRKLGRTSSHRWAMLRNLVTSLLEHEQIETTDARAKEVRRVAERMITLGKRGSLHARRRALRVVRSREVTAKLFDELAPRFRERPGGYTRVLKVRRRIGDAAPLSLVELVDRTPAAPKAGEKPAKAKADAKARRAETKAEKAVKPAAKRAAKGQQAGEAKGRGRARGAASDAASGGKKTARTTKRDKG